MAAAADTASKVSAHACQRCQTRKKRCDKALPSCDRCQRLSLGCKYVKPTPVTKWKHTSSKPSVLGNGTDTADVLKSAHTSQTDGDSGGVSAEIMKLLQNLGEFADKLTDRFFSTIHNWLPFLSKRSFHRQLVKYPDHDEPNFDLLLVTVCLLVRRPDSVPPGAISQKELYHSIKRLVAQLLAENQQSRNMIRSLILISILEYSCQDKNKAFLTLTTAIRLAYLLKLHKPPGKVQDAADDSHEDSNNLWWALVICERALVIETTLASQPLLTPYPGSDRKLPREIGSQGSASAGIMSFADLTGFERAAQAAGLLDRVLNLIRSGPVTQESVAELAGIDLDLQTLLHTVFAQMVIPSGGFCWSVGTGLKALFVLHSAMVYHEQCAEITEETVAASRAVLLAAANMMSDIAASHSGTSQIDEVFPMSVFNIRTTKTIIKEQPGGANDRSVVALQNLESSLGRLTARWTLETPKERPILRVEQHRPLTFGPDWVVDKSGLSYRYDQ